MPVAWVGTSTHVYRATHRSRHRHVIKMKIHLRKGCSGRLRQGVLAAGMLITHFGTLVHQSQEDNQIGACRQRGFSMERWLWTISGYLRFEGTELQNYSRKKRLGRETSS